MGSVPISCKTSFKMISWSKPSFGISLTGCHIASLASSMPVTEGKLSQRPVFTGRCDNLPSVTGMDDASEAIWHPVNEIPKLGFDHEIILKDVLHEMGTDPINHRFH